jgi:hypothetical protein
MGDMYLIDFSGDPDDRARREEERHPRLPEGELHDAGFDCRCGWDEDRRREESSKWRASLEEFWASPGGQERV